METKTKTAQEIQRAIDETVAVILEAAGGNLSITVLNKALFYTDLHALRDLGSTVTGTAYAALPNGPVVDQYREKLWDKAPASGLIECVPASPSKMLFRTKTEATFEILTPAQRAIAREIGAKFRRKTAVGVSAESHNNPGWLVAYDPSAKGKLINMRIAMQEIVGDDDWLDADLTVEEASAFDDCGELEAW